MVEPDDPLSPGQVLDPIPVVGELPIQDRHDLQRLRVEEQVLRAVVAVHEAGHTIFQPPQGPARSLQDLPGVALVDQLLPVPAGHERHGGASGERVDLDDVGHRDDASDARQGHYLNAQPLRRVDTLVLLDDELAIQPRLVGVPVSKSTLGHSSSSHRSSSWLNRPRWSQADVRHITSVATRRVIPQADPQPTQSYGVVGGFLGSDGSY
jgi:hypothetical protein